jgi:plasmid stability protein
MPSITLKNLPEDLLMKLKECAAAERRSVNQQAIHLLENSLRARRPGSYSEAAEQQLAAWKDLAGRWTSEESADAEISAIYEARTLGRDVEL